MPATTVSIVCDVSLPNALEFTSATFRFQLSEPDYDTADNETIATTEITVAANASGVATVSLWPVTRGTRNSFYRVSLSASVMIGGVPKWQDYSLGVIRPPATGAPHDLADLLAQSSGGIIVGSTVYATLADAVAAAVAAAADAEATVADAVDDLNAAGAVILADVTAAGNAAVAAATTQANRADTEADRAQTEANRADTQADRAEAAAAGYESLGNAIALAEAEVARAALEADRAEAAADGVAASEAAAADSAAAAEISAGIAVAAVESTTSEGATWRPEYYGATGIGNDTAALAAWLASGGPLHVIKGKVYQFNAALTFPAGVKISGHLNLVWIGVGSVPIATINDDVAIDDLTISCPTTTGNGVTIGRNYKGRSIVINGFGNSGAGAVTISDPEGLDLDLFESTGGFQRPLTLGNGLVWSVGGRIGMVRVRDYTRGIGMNYLDGFILEGYDIAGRNALASFTAGHNGIIAAGLRNCRFGQGRIADAGEHLFRLGGAAEMGASYNNTFGDMQLEGAGGSPIKLNANAVCYDFRFGDINAVGKFASVPGGNRELLRLSHCRNITFGQIRLVIADGFAYAAQDAVALNNATDIVIQGLHVEGLGQSVLDCVSGQDIGDGLGNGDVRNITIGSVTGRDLTSRTMVRLSMAAGFEVSGLHISGVDYFSDGPLFAANGATVVDGACSISGRIRKTDLSTLPAVTNLPDEMAVDLVIGRRKVLAKGNALAWAETVTPEMFAGADDDARLTDFFAYLMSTGAHGVMSGEYRISTDFMITAPIKLDGFGSTVRQTVSPHGFIQLRAGSDGSSISNITVLADLTVPRVPMTGRYRGYSRAQRHCAIWAESGGNKLRNIHSEGMYNTVCMRGPVVRYPSGAGYTGADTDPNTAYDYSGHAENNDFEGLTCINQDFVLTGHQQKNPRIVNFGARDIVDTNETPPHAAYCRNNGDGALRGSIIGGFISQGSCYTCPDGVAFKFYDCIGTTFADLSAYDTAGVGNFVDCTDCTWSDLSGQAQKGENAIARYAFNMDGCTGTVNGLTLTSVDANTMGLLGVDESAESTNSSTLIINNASASTDFETGNGVTEALVRLSGASSIQIRGIDYTARGNQTCYMFTTVDTATITVTGVRSTGVTNLANGAGGRITVQYNDFEMLGSPLAYDGDVVVSKIADLSTPAILNRKYVIGLGADPTANADAINAAVALYSGHGSGKMDLYFPSGTYEIGVPNAWKVGGAQEGSAVRLLTGGGLTFVGNGSVLVPATNEIEIFVQHGAADIGFHKIKFDNSPAGILQNTAKPASLTPYAGVPGLGNAANTAIRQYSGASLTVDDCEFYAFNTAIGYDGNRANNAVLVGDFVSRNVKTYGCAFGHLIEQPKTLTLTGGRCYDNVDSLNSSGSTLEDPGHLLYVADRAGAAPEQIIVKDIMSFNGLSSALKIRKGECLTISDFTAFNEGRGLELHLIQRGAVSNVSVKLKDTAETNQNAVELTDCGTVELSNMTLDVRGASAFGLRARTDLNSQPWHNRGWRMSNVTVINDYSGDTTKAPFIVQGQTYFEMVNMRFEHRGTTAGTRFPLDIRGCSNGTITNPTHIRPDGSPTDGHRLVSLDATCVNVAINLPATGLSTTAALTGTSSAAVLSINAGATGTTVTGREGQAVTVALLGTVASTDRRAVVTDSTVVAAGNFGAIVAGGGSNRVPVFHDGTNWRIG